MINLSILICLGVNTQYEEVQEIHVFKKPSHFLFFFFNICTDLKKSIFY